MWKRLRRWILGYDPKLMQDIMLCQMRMIERQQDVIYAAIVGKDHEKIVALTRRLAATRRELQKAIAEANDGVIDN